MFSVVYVTWEVILFFIAILLSVALYLFLNQSFAFC
uniref:Uncharacterized protein n=1 Tax=Arundo donax TaxID=35708 RepID=A0A0A9ABQ4_ARUDO